MILTLDDAGVLDVSVGGGKASALARLRRAGFPVPDGFVVTAVEDASDAKFAERLAALLAASGADTQVAVRSSGFAEDSKTASFAGQYETVLGVCRLEDVRAAVQRCFASFADARARAYQDQRAVPGRGGAVLVQRLIPAAAAGVAFTADPVTGARDRVVIDAAPGLGAAVVGGLVTPDGFVVLKESGAVVGRRQGGPIAAIDADVAAAVATLAQQVEAHEGHAVDMEWALHDGVVHLLQARPITTAVDPPPPGWVPELNTAIDPRFPLYSSGNVSEILPGCVTPLTYSMFARAVERAFRIAIESIGSMPDIGPGQVVVGFFYHRVYLNVSYFMAAADNSPGATRDTVYEELVGPSPTRHPAFTAADLLPWRLVKGAGIIARFLALQARLDGDIAAMRQRYDATRAAFAEDDPAQWDDQRLATWIEVNDGDNEPAVVHIRASQFANASFAFLRSLTRGALGDDSGALASVLVTGIGTLASSGPAERLYELAQTVSADPALMRLFAGEPDDAALLTRIEGDPAAAAFRDELRTFVGDFGHRGFREAELRNPSWGSQPALVLGQVRHHLQPGSVAPAAIAERQRAAATAARADALSRLSAWRRGTFTSALDKARRHIAAREETKDLLLRFFALTRRVVSAVQARLADVLERPDDIHFLLAAEVVAALRGTLGRDDVTAIVSRRRREFAWSAQIALPKVQDGVIRTLDADPASRGDGDLTGVPVSPGIVEGTARVVLDPHAAQLLEGEILVAPVTDIAWTPLFIRAAGLVVEVGGPLSHGSIVAREFGLPAVTAVAGATRRIRSGDRVRVDGTRGVVMILPA